MNSLLNNWALLTLIGAGWILLGFWLWRIFSATESKDKSQTTDDSAINPLESKQREGVVLALEVPRENEKTPMAAEILFSSLHGIYQDEGSTEYLSFEIYAREKSIRFYVWVPKHLQGYVEGQMYAQYPDIDIREADDYFDEIDFQKNAWSAELGLQEDDIVPLRTFESFEVDPLSGITAALSKLDPSEEMVIQLLIKPEPNDWRQRSLKYIEEVEKGGSKGLMEGMKKEFSGLLSRAGKEILGGEDSETESGDKEEGLSPGVQEVLSAIEEKSTKLGFRTGIRIVASGDDKENARARLQLGVAAFKQFNSNSLNGFEVTELREGIKGYQEAATRDFPESNFVLNVEELASTYHLPNETVATPNIVWSRSKKGGPPADLPLVSEHDEDEITPIAETDFRGRSEHFGIKMKDRRRHVYVVGKSGVGKSTLLENMTIADLRADRGVGVIDPHGEYVDTLLDYIPSYRLNDVILFDVSDQEHPIGFNVLEVRNPSHKSNVASGVVSVFKKIFGHSWGPRLEYWLRNSILALLDYPNATLMMVPKLLADNEFRKKVIAQIKDPVLKSTWQNEFQEMSNRQQSQTIGPILNKVGQFLANPIIRNIVSQPQSAIDFREVMDEGKILLVKLPKGSIGEDNATLLGSFIVTQLQLAALSRADIPEEERRDFYMYVDEFQNFATESFETILSEARKYHLSLTLANQYMAQLVEEVKDSVFGNVGTLISFRVGADDANYLAREFSPVFDEEDLVNLDIFNIYVKLSIDGLTTDAFSSRTLPLPEELRTNNKDKLIRLSREQYAEKKEFVESKVHEFSVEEGGDQHSGGGDGSQNKPSSTNPSDALSKMVQKVEKKAGDQVSDEGKKQLQEKLTEDGGAQSFEEALKQAQKQKQGSEKTQNSDEQKTGEEEN